MIASRQQFAIHPDFDMSVARGDRNGVTWCHVENNRIGCSRYSNPELCRMPGHECLTGAAKPSSDVKTLSVLARIYAAARSAMA